MTAFVLLHADRAATLLADDPIVPADDVARFAEVTELLGETAALRADADRARDAALAEARDEGFAAGHAEGRAAGEASIAEALLRLAKADAARAEAQRADLARLAIGVVRRIAGSVGAPEFVAGIAAQAAVKIAPDGVATIRVHPDAAPRASERLAGLRHVAVEEDAALDYTDCVVETALGRTHAGLETQLALLERSWELTA